MSNRNPSIEYLCKALTDYAATMAPACREAFTLYASKHIENMELELKKIADSGKTEPTTPSPETKL